MRSDLALKKESQILLWEPGSVSSYLAKLTKLGDLPWDLQLGTVRHTSDTDTHIEGISSQMDAL